MQLDIVDFYPSITETLFEEAINFASSFVTISETQKQILLNARQSILFHNGCVWKKSTGLFDVTMGAYDGAELCELVGLLILHKMRTNFPSVTFGLYRDDGLGVHRRTPGPTLEKNKKEIIKLFQEL